MVKFITKALLNSIALYVASLYFPGFILEGGIITIIIAGIMLAFLNAFIRPILKLVSLPFIWLTLGLFNIVINMVILWVADKFLSQIIIVDLTTLFWVSIIISLFNVFI